MKCPTCYKINLKVYLDRQEANSKFKRNTNITYTYKENLHNYLINTINTTMHLHKLHKLEERKKVK